MNKKELVEIVRTVVREEINNALPQYLMEVLAERITAQSVITEGKEPNIPAEPRKKPSAAFAVSVSKAPIRAPTRILLP